MSTSDWDNYRPTIERLYRQYDLKKVMEVMESEHGFKKSESSYRRQFREWGLRKNFSQHVWKQVVNTIASEGERIVPGSEILVGGQRQSYEKVLRKCKEVSFPRLAEKHLLPGQRQENVSPNLSDLVTFRSLPLGTFLSIETPWLKFTASWNQSLTEDLPPNVSTLHVLRHLHTPSHPNPFSNLEIITEALLPRLRHKDCSHNLRINEMTDALSVVMPSENMGHHRSLAESLYSPDITAASLALTYVHLFLISNNLIRPLSLSVLEKGAITYDQHVTRRLRTMPFFNARSLRSLLSVSDASFRAILEILCNSVARTSDLEAWWICLGAGLWPGEILRSYGHLYRLLDLVALFGEDRDVPEITRLILSRRKDPTPTHDDLATAISFDNLAMAEELIRLGAKVEATHLKSSLLWQKTKTVCFCLAHGADVDTRFAVGEESPNDGVESYVDNTRHRVLDQLELFKQFLVADPIHFMPGEKLNGPKHYREGQASLTALGLAILTEHDEAIPIISAGSKCIGAEQEVYFNGENPGFLQTSATGLAVLADTLSEKAMAKLLQANADQILPDGLVPPLILACLVGDKKALHLLLDAGADVSQAEKHRVMVDSNLSLVDVLFDPDPEVCEKMLAHSAKFPYKTMARAFVTRDAKLLPVLAAQCFPALLFHPTKAGFELPWVVDIFEDAVADGDEDLVDLFLNEPTLRPVTEICDVQEIGSLKVGQRLREAGFLARIADRRGIPLLSKAIEARNLDLIDLLLEFDLDLAFKVPGYTRFGYEHTPMSVLEYATDGELFILADLLIDRGAPITAKAFNDLILRACQNPNLTLLSEFLRRLLHQDQLCKAEVAPSERQGAIFMALQTRNDAALQYLLDYGIDPTGHPKVKHKLFKIPPYKITPKLWAADVSSLSFAVARESTMDNVTMLLRSARWSSAEKQVALACAMDASNQEMIEILLASGADLYGDVFRSYSSSLPLAIQRRDWKVLKLLLKQGCDLPWWPKTWESRTALQCAVEYGDMEVIEFLVACGADINASAGPTKGATALKLAAKKGSLKIAAFLLDNGADPNAPGADVGGDTALQAAARHGRLDMVHLLLGRGALTDGPYREACVEAVAYAQANGSSVVAQVLKEAIEWIDMDETNVKKVMLAWDSEYARYGASELRTKYRSRLWEGR